MMFIGEKERAAEEFFAKPNAKIGTWLNANKRINGVDANFLLYKAAERGNVACMEELVSKWEANVNAPVHTEGLNIQEHTAPPMFAAVQGSSVIAVEWLLEHGADPDGKCYIDDCTITSLFTAAEHGNARIGKLLLDAGADVNAAKSTNGNTPLYIAVQNHHPAMVSLLLYFYANPNKFLQPRTIQTTSPLERAVGCGHPRLVAQLIHAGAEITFHAIIFLNKVQESKKSIDQFRRSISDEELIQIKDLLAIKSHLKGNDMYEKAKEAERIGDYRRALVLLRVLHENCPCTQTKLDIERLVEAIYGVKGSDCTISIWDQVPLMTQSEPTHYQDYAWTQLGRKIYRHGGLDKAEKIEQNEELWELDIDTRIWTLLETSGKSPGPRSGHTMFAWENDLYVWGGICMGASFDSKLYRLVLKGNAPVLSWEVVKTTMKPPGRQGHAGCVYRGKYFITGGCLGGSIFPTKDTWQLNLSTFKWKAMKDGPIDRHCHGMWAANNKLYILGGRRFHKDPDMNPNHASYSIENFVSLHLGSNEWSNEPIIGDRPFDLSEFTILPLYSGVSNNDEDPSSIVIWGGYGQLDRVNGPNPKSDHEMNAYYGDQLRYFTQQYRRRLLRFYTDTHVFKHLRSTTSQLPKAQSFAAEIKSDSSSIELLVGGGYGFTGESMAEKSNQLNFLGDTFTSPKSSNKVFRVITGDIGSSYAALDNVNGKSWAWNFCRSAAENMPQLLVDFSPCSPTVRDELNSIVLQLDPRDEKIAAPSHFVNTLFRNQLHKAIDYTHEDFTDPPCDSVKPNDQDTLLGVRVRLCKLVKRSDLNGKIGRCGTWQKENERYQVFIPRYEEGGFVTLAVKPLNLRIAPKLNDMDADAIQELLAKNPYTQKKFPDVCVALNFFYDTSSVKKSIVDQTIENCDPSGGDRDPNHLFDTACGPLNRKAQAVMRTLSMKDFETNIAVVLSPDLSMITDSHQQAQMKSRIDLYSNFVKQMREKDIPRVKEFEKRLSAFSDTEIFWLKLEASIDGTLPGISRTLIVSSDVYMESLNNNILCPAFGWKSYNHAGYFRRCGMCFLASNDSSRKSEDHQFAMQVMEKEVWIGPKKSATIDTMHQPLYIGGSVANDKNITLGQLFALDDIHKNEMFLQFVHDIGDWWSHSIKVTRYDESKEDIMIPGDATVAYLVEGSGGVIPEDVGGLKEYFNSLLQLTGKISVDIANHQGMKTQLNPGSEQWWEILNKGFRSRANRIKFLSNPLQFDIESARQDLETELRRPKLKSSHANGSGMTKFDMGSGLSFDMHKKATVSVPKKATDSCAYCGVTVALRKCSACESVAYCSVEHSKLNWRNHKADCKRVQKQMKKR